MLLINFSHPLTEEQLRATERLSGRSIVRVVEIETQFDNGKPFADQARRLVESVGLSSVEWQTERLLINLPSYNYAAALVLTELHGRMGYFPAILRLRPVADSTPQQFEAAEVLNLQAVRDEARAGR